jgi:hypothetical protein
MLMNSKFIHEQADAFAGRVRRETGGDIQAQVARAWQVAFAAAPAAVDVERGVLFVTQQTELYRTQKAADPDSLALTNYCQALLSSNRFLYVD